MPQNKKCTLNVGAVCLSFVLTLGGCVILMPYSGTGRDFSAAFSASFFLAGALFPLMRRFKNNRSCRCLLALLFLLSALDCFNTFCGFATKNMLNRTHYALAAAVFALAVLFALLGPESASVKFSLLSAPASAFLILLFFLLLSPRFKAENIASLSCGTAGDTLVCFLRAALPSALSLSVYSQYHGRCRKGAFCGFFAGGIFSLLAALCAIMLFGAAQAEGLSYPFSDAVSTLSVGYLFTRMDGLVYLVFFACALVRTAVLIRLAADLIKPKRPRAGLAVLTALLLCLSIVCNTA